MGCCLITDIHTLGTQKKGHNKKIKTKKITLETLAYDNLMTCMWEENKFDMGALNMMEVFI